MHFWPELTASLTSWPDLTSFDPLNAYQILTRDSAFSISRIKVSASVVFVSLGCCGKSGGGRNFSGMMAECYYWFFSGERGGDGLRSNLACRWRRLRHYKWCVKEDDWTVVVRSWWNAAAMVIHFCSGAVVMVAGASSMPECVAGSRAWCRNGVVKVVLPWLPDLMCEVLLRFRGWTLCDVDGCELVQVPWWCGGAHADRGASIAVGVETYSCCADRCVEAAMEVREDGGAWRSGAEGWRWWLFRGAVLARGGRKVCCRQGWRLPWWWKEMMKIRVKVSFWKMVTCQALIGLHASARIMPTWLLLVGQLN